MVCELGKPIARSTTESTSELFTHLVPRSLSNSRNSSAAGSGGIQLFETFRSEKCACQICTWHTFPGWRYNENPTVSADFSFWHPDCGNARPPVNRNSSRAARRITAMRGDHEQTSGRDRIDSE